MVVSILLRQLFIVMFLVSSSSTWLSSQELEHSLSGGGSRHSHENVSVMDEKRAGPKNLINISRIAPVSRGSNLQESDSDEVRSPAWREFSGLNSALFENLQSVVRGDFLLTINQDFDSVDLKNESTGRVVNLEQQFRFRFDFKLKNYLLVTSQQIRILDLTSEEGAKKEINKVSHDAHLIKGSTGTSFTRFNFHRFNRFEKILDIHGKVPDFRHIGFLTFPTSMDNEKFKIFVEVDGHSDDVSIISNENGKLLFRLVSKVRHDPDFEFQTSVLFDSKRMVPISREVFGVQTKPELIRGWVGEERYEWKEIEGVYVPQSVKVFQPEQDNNGENTEKAIQQTVAKFHWFSVNKEFEPGDFDEENLRDNERLHSLLEVDRSEDKESTQKNKESTEKK